MRRVIRAAVSYVSGEIVFDSAYPAAEKVEFETFHRDVFVKCSKRLKHFEIVKRIQRDDELVKLCTRVVSVILFIASIRVWSFADLLFF